MKKRLRHFQREAVARAATTAAAAGHPLTPAPVAESAPAATVPVSAPTQSPQLELIIAMNTVTAKIPVVKLGMNNYVKLCDWLRANDLTVFPSLPLLCDAATVALGFRIPYSSAKEAVALLDIKQFQRPAKVVKPDAPADAQSITARELARIMAALGIEQSETFAGLLEAI